MTNEQKQLLFIDLCGRLPYGVMVRGVFLNYNKDLDRIQYEECDKRLEYRHLNRYKTLKPYLRPMSSMTEEERREYDKLIAKCLYDPEAYFFDNNDRLYDWLNKNKFDYRGLIEKGLALEASEDMYKTE